MQETIRSPLRLLHPSRILLSIVSKLFSNFTDVILLQSGIITLLLKSLQPMKATLLIVNNPNHIQIFSDLGKILKFSLNILWGESAS